MITLNQGGFRLIYIIIYFILDHLIDSISPKISQKNLTFHWVSVWIVATLICCFSLGKQTTLKFVVRWRNFNFYVRFKNGEI